MKKLDIYLLKYFFGALVVVISSFGATIVIINAVESLPHFIDNNVPMVQILEYYFYFAGWVLKSFMPMFVLLAGLFSISILARNNEVLGMKACGVSLYRMALPLLLVTLLISAGHFCYNEFLYPPANKKRLEIKNFTIKRKSKKALTSVSNIHRQIAPGYFYTIKSFDVRRRTGKDVKVYKRSGRQLSRLVTGKELAYEDNQWLALDGIERNFVGTPGETYRKFDTLILSEINEVPDDLAIKIGKPEDMGYEELRTYIALMKRTGGPYIREAVDLKIKLAYPLASFLVVLVCIPFAANPTRGGIAVSIATGAGISLIYFIMFRVLQSAGYNEKIPEVVAVWGINSLFLLIGIVSMASARK